MHRALTSLLDTHLNTKTVKISRYGILLKVLTCLLLVSAFSSCSSNKSKPEEILGRWKMEAIQYDDGSEKTLGGENAIVFEPTAVIEEIEGLGKRRYPYERNDNTLKLVSGGEKIDWVILKQEPKAMKISTPIGIYIVSKE